MNRTIDFYFAPISPWTYLGVPAIREVARKHGATINYKPVHLPQLFETAGVKPLAERPEPIRKNRLNELRRWREHRNMPLNLHPAHFPTSPAGASRMIIAAVAIGEDAGDLAFAYLRAVWAEERDIGDDETVIAIAGECGLDGRALFEQAAGEEIATIMQANTDEAIAHGAWGSPSFVVDGELFFGQDRITFVDQKLA